MVSPEMGTAAGVAAFKRGKALDLKGVGCGTASFFTLCEFPKGAAVAAMCHRRFLGREKAGDHRSPLQEFAQRLDSGWL